jgi:hypothetical protein
MRMQRVGGAARRRCRNWQDLVFNCAKVGAFKVLYFSGGVRWVLPHRRPRLRALVQGDPEIREREARRGARYGSALCERESSSSLFYLLSFRSRFHTVLKGVSRVTLGQRTREAYMRCWLCSATRQRYWLFPLIKREYGDKVLSAVIYCSNAPYAASGSQSSKRERRLCGSSPKRNRHVSWCAPISGSGLDMGSALDGKTKRIGAWVIQIVAQSWVKRGVKGVTAARMAAAAWFEPG